MKRHYKRIWAYILAAALLTACLPTAGAGVDVAGIGTELRHDTTMLHGYSTLHETTLLHNAGGRQEERWLEVGASSHLTPMAVFGGTVHSGNLSLPEAAERLRAQGYDVVAGLNADFYTVANGIPCGLLITEGVLRCSDNNQYAMGFLPGGGAFIGQPRLNITASTVANGVPISVPIKHVNRIRSDDGVYLYTSDFGPTTRTTLDGTHVVLTANGPLKVGEPLAVTVTKIISGKEAYMLTEGQMVLSCTTGGPITQLQQLYEGMLLELRITAPDARWLNLSCAVGGQYLLASGGSVNSSLAGGTAPRTAVGVKPDGTAVFYTVDGRQPEYSAGLSLADVARRLISLGCTDVLELDGGGSTIMGAAYPGQAGLSVLGRPSDGTPRKSSNYIFFVNNTPQYDSIGNVFVYPGRVTMLQNATLAFSAAAADVNYHALSAGVPSWTVADNRIGFVGGEGDFHALLAGVTEVQASAAGRMGSAQVTVVDRVDSITVTNAATSRAITSLAVNPGEKIKLNATGILDGLAVYGQASSFEWNAAGSAGTVDEHGTFTASDTVGGHGVIVIGYGDVTATVQVTVGRLPEIAADFENGMPGFTAGEGISIAPETDLTKVKYGRGSARIDYSFADLPQEKTALTLGANIALRNAPVCLNLLLYGDGSGNLLTLVFADLANMPVEISAGAIDFVGYRMLSIPLPAGVAKLTGLSVMRTADPPGAASGTLWLDQLVSAYSPVLSTEPPFISLEALDMMSTPGTMLVSIRVSDGAGAPVSQKQIQLTYDGAAAAFSYDPLTCQLTASLPTPPTDYHLLCVEASDAAGNRARMTHVLEMPEGTPDPEKLPFADAEGHWAKRFISYLDARGVLSTPQNDGERLFRPDDTLTRAEMAVFMVKVLKIDASRYSQVELPFSDLAQLPADALPYIRAAYALGMIQGKSLYGGPLYFDPHGTVSRADFMTIVGRSLPKGFAVSPLFFPDVGQVPSYAVDYVEVMVSLGIVSGYTDGTLMPLREVTRAEAVKMLFYFY